MAIHKEIRHPQLLGIKLDRFFHFIGGIFVPFGGEFFGTRVEAAGRNLDSFFSDMERAPERMFQHDLSTITYAVKDLDNQYVDNGQVYTANISLASLTRPDAAVEIAKVLDEKGARHLVLEITEQRAGHTYSLEQYDQIEKNVQALRRQGVRFLLDDLANGEDPRLQHLLHHVSGVKFDMNTTRLILEGGFRSIHKTTRDVLCETAEKGHIIVAEGVPDQKEKIKSMLDRFNRFSRSGVILLQGHAIDDQTPVAPPPAVARRDELIAAL